MVYKPRTVDEVYTSLRDRLTNKIPRLTNFVETSFNFVWTQAFAQRFRDNEVALLAAQLSGYIDTAGGPVTDDQLEALGITGVSAAEVNEYMQDEDLDELVQIVGVEREEGSFAEGTLDITTVSAATTIPAGTQFATEPSGNESLVYETDETVSTDAGETSVSVGITATDIGEVYNVGSGQVTFLVDPPTGVVSSTNPAAITGGEDEETNDELRTRAKRAIFDNSGGGTAAGVEGFVRSNTTASNVSVVEYPGGNASTPGDYEGPGGPGGPSSDTPFGDVIVEGGDDTDVQDAIDEARPVAIQHNLVRPFLVSVNVNASLLGSDIDTVAVENAVTNLIDGLELGDELYRDQVIREIMNADSSIENIDTLDIEVHEESIEFSAGTDVYPLRVGTDMEPDGITLVEGTLGGTPDHTFIEDTDYQEIDNGSGSDDAIDWSLAGDDPDDGTNFFVTYTIENDITVDEYEKIDTNDVTATIV